MNRSARLFEIIQILRAQSAPITADRIADMLEVSVRTIYRDIAALQAMRTPIEGEAGIGYVMRGGYDLPALNFDAEEIEALVVGLSLLSRTGDTGLQKAAKRISRKIEELRGRDSSFFVSDHGVETVGTVNVATLRAAIRDERKLHLVYRDGGGAVTDRTVKPIAIAYFLEVVLLAAWCELRRGFRHFRLDRIERCDLLDDRFAGDGDKLRREWEISEG